MSDINVWPTIAQHHWKFRARRQTVRVALIHATRGNQGYPTETEFAATVNWFTSPHNIIRGGEVYASMASRIIGGGGRQCVVMPDVVYPAYSAGHADPIAVSFEICQSNANQPFDTRDVERAAQEVAIVCKQHGIPARHITYLSGDNHEAPGIAFHDASANGDKYGKSDPGVLFDREGFCARVADLMEDGLSQEHFDALKTAIAALATANAKDFAKLQDANTFIGEELALILAGKTAEAEQRLRYVFAASGKAYPA